VNQLDVLLVCFAAAAAVGGYRIGFVTRVVSWVGMIIGVVAGSGTLPWIVDHFQDSLSRSDLILVSAGVVIASGLAGQALGLLIGSKLHLAIPPGRARSVDAVVGSVAGVVGVAVFVWLLAPAMADVPEWPAAQARGSSVVRSVNDLFPEPPDTTKSLRRLLGDRYPQVFDAFREAPDVGPAPKSSGLSQATADRITQSVVKVEGQACDRIQDGTGFVVAPDLVATNAHVVAGEGRTDVIDSQGETHSGRVVAFDPERDLALVSVPGLNRPVLPLATGRQGDKGAVFGHPGGGPLRLAPFAIGRALVATGTDIYDDGGARRQVLVLASSLRPGDSGSALVDPSGHVLGVAFAIAPDKPGVAYALAVSELRAVLRGPHAAPVDAGPCIA
jgi:S1-C subfamily serine protease